jgi:NADPH:quinone reductase-like Zn-dependent oxidoreductase
VGGRAGADLAKILAEGGTLVTYGAMGLEPFTLSNAQLIFRDILARGFWITRWMRKANRAERQELFAEMFGLLKNGVLSTPVEQAYPLAAYREALAHAARAGRVGKVMFTFD